MPKTTFRAVPAGSNSEPPSILPLLIVLQSCSIHASTGSAHGKFAQPCRQERVRHRSVKWSWRAFRKDTGPRRCQCRDRGAATLARSEEHTSELQSLMRISYAVFCLKKKKKSTTTLHKIIRQSARIYANKQKPHNNSCHSKTT